MVTQKQKAAEHIKKYLNGAGWALTKRLQHVVGLLEGDTESPGLREIELIGDNVKVTYETWYTNEYAIEAPEVTFPAWYLYTTNDEITADVVEKKAAEERAKEEAKAKQRKAERRKLFEELKKEFGDE